jgi:hypothetical protein
MANSVGDAERSPSDLRLVRGGQFDRVLRGEPAADMSSGIVARAGSGRPKPACSLSTILPMCPEQPG